MYVYPILDICMDICCLVNDHMTCTVTYLNDFSIEYRTTLKYVIKLHLYVTINNNDWETMI